MALHVMRPSRARRRARRPRAARPAGAGSVRTWIEIALLACFAVVMLFPVVWMLETSLKEVATSTPCPPKFLGFDVTFDHYKDVFVQRGGSGGRRTWPRVQELAWSSRPLTLLATALGVPAAWAYSRFR